MSDPKTFKKLNLTREVLDDMDPTARALAMVSMVPVTVLMDAPETIASVAEDAYDFGASLIDSIFG